MKYKELLRKIAKSEGFDSVYTLRHLTVDECFKNDDALGKDWTDQADKQSIRELSIKGE